MSDSETGGADVDGYMDVTGGTDGQADEDAPYVEKFAILPSVYHKEQLQLYPNYRRALCSLVAAALTFVLFLVVFFAMAQNPALSGTSPEATAAKRGTSLSMMNQSAPICTEAYTHSCGDYNARYVQSSLFEETQLMVVHGLRWRRPFDFSWMASEIDEIDDLPVSDDDLAEIGLFGCVDVDVAPDYINSSRVALYFSPPCLSGCPTVRHPPSPQLVKPSDTLRLTPKIQAVANVAARNGLNMWWFPPANAETFARWLDDNCENVTADMQWNHTVAEMSPFSTLVNLYNVPVFLRGPSISDLVSTVRDTMAEYIERAASFAGKGKLRQAMVRRVRTIPIHYGHGPAFVPRCALNTSLWDCLIAQWEARVNMLQARVTVSATWQMSGLEVNAYFSPLSQGVYLPFGIAQRPFYDSGWPMWMKMSTLGAVIAHEIGHALQPGWSFTTELDEDEWGAVTQFEDCLMHAFEATGSKRNLLTLSENWADAISVRTVAWYLRKVSVITTADGLLLWMQTWCTAGSPKFKPLSIDPHATPYMRVNGTMHTLPSFYTAYKCSQPAEGTCR